MPIPNNITFEFLPSIALAEPNAAWTNASRWIEDTEYQFTQLAPYTRYNVTVYVKIKGQPTVFPPAKYLPVMTGEYTPSEPWMVEAKQKNGTRIEVSWQPPHVPNGLITGYDVFMTPPIPPMTVHTQKTSVIIDTAFEAAKNYSFWVVAKNKEYASGSSNVQTITFDGSANIDHIEDLKVIDKTNHSVTLSWKKIDAADGYIITPRAPLGYPVIQSYNISNNNVYTVESLAPGTRYTFEVGATKKHYVGKMSSITGMTKDQPLPSITVLEPLLLKSQGTTVKLTWDPPKSNRKVKWQYAVHYALSMHDLYQSKNLEQLKKFLKMYMYILCCSKIQLFQIINS